ncbi:nuclear localization sequence binding protein [Teratosphaeriaceae sp. CCFEE 6253]|nr:nuclear localization sequence binding protein [Teratosphaeriaceae sp. CCFEE 6253]
MATYFPVRLSINTVMALQRTDAGLDEALRALKFTKGDSARALHAVACEVVEEVKAIPYIISLKGCDVGTTTPGPRDMPQEDECELFTSFTPWSDFGFDAEGHGDAEKEPTCTLFMTNHGRHVEKDLLVDLYSKYSPVKEIHILRLSGTLSNNTVCGYVYFWSKKDATTAYKALNGAVIAGLAVHLEYADDYPAPNMSGGRGMAAGEWSEDCHLNCLPATPVTAKSTPETKTFTVTFKDLMRREKTFVVDEAATIPEAIGMYGDFFDVDTGKLTFAMAWPGRAPYHTCETFRNATFKGLGIDNGTEVTITVQPKTDDSYRINFVVRDAMNVEHSLSLTNTCTVAKLDHEFRTYTWGIADVLQFELDGYQFGVYAQGRGGETIGNLGIYEGAIVTVRPYEAPKKRTEDESREFHCFGPKGPSKSTLGETRKTTRTPGVGHAKSAERSRAPPWASSAYRPGTSVRSYASGPRTVVGSGCCDGIGWGDGSVFDGGSGDLDWS